MGGISGLVIDEGNGAFLSGVSITLLFPGAEAQIFGDESPQESSVVTDGKGRYRIRDVPTGIYKLQFFKDGYAPRIVSDVEVLPNDVTKIDVPLAVGSEKTSQDVFEMEEFEVSSQALGQQGVALEALRKQSPASVDFLTSTEISKYGASDVAEAITRIPGVNLVEGQFAVIRGLNDRYVNTLVNGVPVPSTDPTRQGVQLDLFPSGFVNNLVVEKTFLPYLPGNSGGGSINIITKEFPDEFQSSFKGGVKFNSNAQKNYLRYPTNSNRYLFGTAKSDFAPVPSTKQNLTTPLPYAPFAATSDSPPVGATFSGSIGDSFEVFDRKLGYYFGGSYNSSYTTITGNTQNRFGSTNPPTPSPSSPTIPPGYNPARPNGGPLFTPGSLSTGTLPRSTGYFDLVQSTGDVLIGGLGTVGMDLDKEGLNAIRAVGFISQNGTTISQRKSNGYIPAGQSAQNDSLTNIGMIGAGGNNSTTLNQDILYYRERQLISAQLIGNHVISELNDLKIDWAINYAKASQDEPDQRVYSYMYNVNTGLYQNSNGADFSNQLRRTWRSIDEDQRFARADLEYDFKFENGFDGKLQSGFFYENSERTTDQEDRFYNAPNSPITGSTPEELSAVFFDERVALNQGLGFAQPSESETSRKIKAYYGMFTVPFGIEELKVTMGARFESTDMHSQGIGNYGTTDAASFWAQPTSSGSTITNGDILGVPAGAGRQPGIIDDNRILPGLSIVYQPTENIVLRAAYSKTVARPSFRELSPYFSTDFVTGDVVLGNPFLYLSEVESWDFRAEYIWDNGDIVAVSLFYKDVMNPIEKILLQDSNTRSTITSYFNNPDRAIVKGFEVEVRKNLGFWDESLEDFSIGANFTMVNASVGVPADVNSTYLINTYNNPFDPSRRIPQGYYVDSAGNVLSPPSERQLFDQPEYIINADFTYRNPDMGTTFTIALYAQSQVLSAAGTGGNIGVPDQYNDAYYQLDIIYSQMITQNLQFKLALKNVTDTPRGVSYDQNIIVPTVQRVSYRKGMDVTMSMEYTF
ncbi:TonB-dependent receptor [Cerasicoccus arenae]|uniref:TonB-dependent receptor n=2 Tax=Cerasicoccus arenae TaxID=424488 RepID=A0A8J3DBW4_9BACT|nr:TonB-dependent receptor [Cerasicoccus arenae]GHC02262.1 hypothetical protein GCM10007047_18500 [Cerasicoccus arenae]